CIHFGLEERGVAVADHVGSDQSRMDRIHPDVVFAIFDRRLARHHEHRALRDDIRAGGGRSAETADRRHVDNGASPALEHAANGQLQHLHGTADVDRPYLVEGLQAGFVQASLDDADADVVAYDRGNADLGAAGFERCGHALWVAYVGHE